MTIRTFDPAVFDNNPIFDTGESGGYWAPRNKQAEVWGVGTSTRVFDPAVFDNNPIFDTGEAGGYWNPKIKQSETWT